MASIGKDPNGCKRILFVPPADGKRRTIRPGKVSAKQAGAFKVVEALVGQLTTGAVDNHVSRWPAALDEQTYGKFAAVGLAKPRGGRATTLGALLDAYIGSRAANAKPRTMLNFNQARDRLLAFFRSDKCISEITAGDTEDFQRHSAAAGFALNTTVGRAAGPSRCYATQFGKG